MPEILLISNYKYHNRKDDQKEERFNELSILSMGEGDLLTGLYAYDVHKSLWFLDTSLSSECWTAPKY